MQADRLSYISCVRRWRRVACLECEGPLTAQLKAEKVLGGQRLERLHDLPRQSSQYIPFIPARPAGTPGCPPLPPLPPPPPHLEEPLAIPILGLMSQALQQFLVSQYWLQIIAEPVARQWANLMQFSSGQTTCGCLCAAVHNAGGPHSHAFVIITINAA